MFYDPLKVALLGIAAWFAVWLCTPVYVTGFVSGGAIAYIALCYLGFAIGAMQARHHMLPAHAPDIPVQWNLPFRKDLFVGTAILGFAGMVMRLFDRVVLRGAGYGGDALQARDTLEQAAVTPIGAVASIFFCFCFMPLIILLASNKQAHRRKLSLLAAAIFALPMVESLLLLSRTTLLVTAGLGFIALVITRYGGNPFNRRLILASFSGLVALSIFSSLIFSTRIEASGGALSESVFTSVYADWLQPNEKASRALASPNRVEAGMYNAILPNGMYYISGLYEMSVLWERPDQQPFAFGRLHFYPLYRALHILFIGQDQKSIDSGDYLYRVGAWQTFFGPVWADFGWLGPLFLAVIGLITQRLSFNVRQGDVQSLPLYSYVLVITLFMPVVNLLSNGLGIFALISCTLFRLRISLR